MLQKHCIRTLRTMPPRGLRLFVRPIEAGDQPVLEAFFARQKEGLTPSTEPACGLLGKLLGDVVAVVALRITDDALRVEDVTVARELRRKWIGRVMMREVEQLAVRMDRRRIVVEHAGDAQEFFRRVGFQSEGERWVRVVR
ncbi:MAG: GNAT family N-acetyltransferase [Thermoanaerobaculia bacterium]